MVEIERKFLVKGEHWKPKGHGMKIQQGYLSITSRSIVRIRIADELAFITIKGIRTGISRIELEYEIPKKEAEVLMEMCLYNPVKKVRYAEKVGDLFWEIDVFEGENNGLVLAEVELENERQEFEFPKWIGKEVTHDNRYYNSWLSQNPYCSW